MMSSAIIILLVTGLSAAMAETEQLAISVMLPLSFPHLDGDAYLPAMDIALELINNKSDLLPGYTLNAIVNDSACQVSASVRSFIDVIFQEPVKVGMVGPICSTATEPVAELAHFWNLVLISAGASSPSLSNTNVYPTFLRSVSPDTSVVEGIVGLMKEYDWSRVASLTQQESIFTAAFSVLSQAVSENNFEEARNFAFGTHENPQTEVIKLYNSPFRIIFLNMYPAKAVEVVCQAQSLGMTRDNGYIWILYSWYGTGWWKTGPSASGSYQPHNCSNEERTRFIKGVFLIDHFAFVEDDMKNIVTDLGLSYNQFFSLYHERIKTPKYSYITENINTTADFTPLFMDALWTIALALNATDRGTMILKNFTYESDQIGKMIYNNSVSSKFFGLSGAISYKANGDRHGYIRYFQSRQRGTDLESVYFGSLPNDTGRIAFKPGESSATIFLDGVVPVDETSDYIDTWLFSLYVVFGCAGLIYASVWLILNIVFRNKKVIKLTSPYLNIVIIIGAMLFYLDIVLFGLDEALVSVNILNGLCMARLWIVVIAFTLLFGTLFAKTWRVYYIFHTSFQQKKSRKWIVHDGFLFLIIGVLLLVDCLFMICFTAIPDTRLKLDTVIIPSTDHDLPIQLSICTSEYQLYALGATLAYKGILLIVGLFLAFETRNIKIKELNDSPLIAMCVYTTVVLSISLAPIGILLTNYVDIHYGLLGSLAMLGVTLILSMLFVPQAYRLIRDPNGDMVFSKTSPQSIGPGGGSMMRNDVSKDTIEFHQNEIDRLRKLRKMSDASGSVSSLQGTLTKNHTSGQVKLLSPVDETEMIEVIVSPDTVSAIGGTSPGSSASTPFQPPNSNGHY